MSTPSNDSLQFLLNFYRSRDPKGLVEHLSTEEFNSFALNLLFKEASYADKINEESSTLIHRICKAGTTVEVLKTLLRFLKGLPPANELYPSLFFASCLAWKPPASNDHLSYVGCVRDQRAVSDKLFKMCQGQLKLPVKIGWEILRLDNVEGFRYLKSKNVDFSDLFSDEEFAEHFILAGRSLSPLMKKEASELGYSV